MLQMNEEIIEKIETRIENYVFQLGIYPPSSDTQSSINYQRCRSIESLVKSLKILKEIQHANQASKITN